MQNRNPFEPPQASTEALAPPPGSPMRRPPTVDRAFWLIIGSGLLALPSYWMLGLHESAGLIAFLIAYVLGFAFLIRAGKNWARMIYAMFFVIGLLGMSSSGSHLARIGAI